MRRVCFYHAGCPDGFGAAWATWRAWGESGEYRAFGHEDVLDPGDYEGDLVVFADIAPPNAELRELGEAAAQVVVLDHHVSARDRYEADPAVGRALRSGNHHVHFDLDHSGAILAWEYFLPDDPAPDLLRYVEDQDLWLWRLPRSEEVNAAIGSYPRSFDCWDELASRPVDELAKEGEPIVRSNRIAVERSLALTHPVALGSRRAEAVNALHQRSAIGHELAKRATFGDPIGVVYRVSGDRVYVSLYSVGDCDVSRIASEYGGGGHRNAAGFSVELKEWMAKLE